jgi:hypothetical protein
MIHHQTITSSVSAELSTSLRQTLPQPRFGLAAPPVPLPTTWHGFAWLLAGVLLVCAGLTVHILLSVQIYQARQQVGQLQAEYQAIERQNAELVWAIAQHTALARVQDRAVALGYEVPQARHYVATPTLTANPPVAQTTPSTAINNATVGLTTSVQTIATPGLFDQVHHYLQLLVGGWSR